ncbi:YkvA family protein [Geochorda subterranea]|uniref:YkvA family protein n=1 Tax=Geochorda subterranea TaxID=3109564 RepID=A0ABZ1BP36_9FIRM|nr:YkvA family protein [Limnochorda sp. LNt]WRP14562.1 YkvA family protein [Limnochorda sp. LNt]
METVEAGSVGQAKGQTPSTRGWLSEIGALVAPVLGRVPAYGRLAWALWREPALSRARKALLIGGLAYSLSPVDLVPGFVPGAGQLDDLLALLYALRSALGALPAASREAHLRAVGLDPSTLEDDIARVRAALGLLARQGVRAGLWTARLGLRAAGLGLRLVGRGAVGLAKAVRRPRRGP